MSRKHHELKTETEFFQEVERGVKKFELRKNDRDFEKFDMVTLKETVKGVYTGRQINPMEIQYVLKGEDAEKYGLKKGYCIINF